jgi:sodium-dependent dicarboxylate transporter 2/3/5
MLPIATPPNAIVFGSGKIRMSQMANYGLALNLIGVAIVTLGTFTLIAPLLGIPLDGSPGWLR